MADMIADVTGELLRIGAIQFGQFEMAPGQFAPISVNLRFVPSYPSILAALAQTLAPLVKIEGLTHLLPMPAAVPLGAAISMVADLPLVYPDDSGTIEGAYDFNVPTILLTDTYQDGAAEQAMIKRAKPLGLDVYAVVTVIDFGKHTATPDGLPLIAWRRLRDLLPGIPALSSSMRQAADVWLSTLD